MKCARRPFSLEPIPPVPPHARSPSSCGLRGTPRLDTLHGAHPIQVLAHVYAADGHARKTEVRKGQTYRTSVLPRAFCFTLQRERRGGEQTVEISPFTCAIVVAYAKYAYYTQLYYIHARRKLLLFPQSVRNRPIMARR